MVPSRIEWQSRPPGRLAAVVRYVGAGVFVAVVLLLVSVVAAMVLTGPSRFVLVAAVVLVVGGPFSLLYLWYGVRYGEASEKRTLREHLPRLRLRWLVLATPVGLVIFLSVGVVPWLALVYAVAGLFVWSVATTGSLGGTFDPKTGRLVRENDGRRDEHDLGGLRSFRSVRLGPYVVCWLRHRRGKALNEPFGLALPAAVFEEVRPALREITDRNAREVDDAPRLTVERAILVAFGLLFVGVAAVLEVRTQATGVGWVIAGWGLLFVVLAWAA